MSQDPPDQKPDQRCRCEPSRRTACAAHRLQRLQQPFLLSLIVQVFPVYRGFMQRVELNTRRRYLLLPTTASSPLASARSSLALASCVRMAASSGSLGRRLTGRREPTLAPSARSHARRAACLLCWMYSSRSNLLVFRVAPPPPGSIHRLARMHTSATKRQRLARRHGAALHGVA